MFSGYWLDDYNFLCPARTKDGETQWVLLTTYAPKDKNGTITCDNITGKYFDITLIDNPNDFKWKGKRVRICYDTRE